MTADEFKQLEENLWQTADTLRANSDLKSSEYATPVLGMIFLKFADNKYTQYENAILDEYKKFKGPRREKKIHEIAIEKCAFYLPEHARFSYLANLPEEKDIDKAMKDAMAAIEEYKPELEGVLPQDELELFDVLKKEKMTQKEEKKVKLAARHLLKRLVQEHPRILIQDWYKDSQTQEKVKRAMEDTLDHDLPESYDRKVFKEKCDSLYTLVYDYATRGEKWAA
jgi:type I restriction-modification system DNA methylase subunit